MLSSLRLRPLIYRNLRELVQTRASSSRGNEQECYKPEDEYSEVPQYPPIEPVTEEYEKLKEDRKWHDLIKRQKTVEEKFIAINLPRYYGWKCLLLKEGEIPYNSLEFVKFITRTHLMELSDLPSFYKNYQPGAFTLAKGMVGELTDFVNDTLRLETKTNDSQLESERERTRLLINGLNRIILKSLSNGNEHLMHLQVDYAPRIESSWLLGSLTETYKPPVYNYGLKRTEIPEEYLERPSNKFIQYIGKPIIQLRSENPLRSLEDMYNAIYLNYAVPVYEYDPFFVFDYEMVRRHVTNIPGFWPGETREFSFLSYHDMNQIKYRPDTYGNDESKETIQCQAILASFAWLISLSSYQGFTSFHDVTYPFTTQTVLTDGREFVFAVYQLNTSELFHKDPLLNPKCNLCWISPKMSLYEVAQGEVTGINVECLKLLVQFYMNQPEAMKDIVRKPYLGDNLGVVANYEDAEKRAWLEKSFKHYASNRPRHRIDLMYEPSDYEKIYNIMFVQAFRKFDKPYDLGEEPYLRKLNEHTPEYIPRAIRPDAKLPKYKQKKFRNTYYPE